MAQTIKFREDPETGEVIYGTHKQSGTTTLHCEALLYDGETLIDRQLIVGIPLDPVKGEEYRDEEVQKAFEEIEEGDPPKVKEVRPDTTKWKSTLIKAAVIEQ